MAVYFFDSSGLVKRYVGETGSAWVASIIHPAANNHIYVARLAGVEVVSAIARCGLRGAISPTDVASALARFRHDFSALYRIIEITPAVATRAMTLAETRALRGYDAVQLAAAVEVMGRMSTLGMKPPVLVSADLGLNAAARAEGLLVENPNDH